ncbi:SDR family NAD(P)-dependent oxidoreductase [Nocardioides panzhihuensis]|uniref:NAD(P)-dependent dehydrogenase (Short-subunit alcohol dehydrogenase family) n=1 Tax=Nocardioides panzhihuensis TaxID=860243 RepID=A0A7Z0DMF5_9ACTN|nr:SDR family NAD(P)-dependent oxidoreductase [Nocardioides panzhihuensis]NYI78340.1 NAD(P)-dependent dehydrogenase (short-subunit alcohol dehydrogenase family) [Nocardioides panzhihuensis]
MSGAEGREPGSMDGRVAVVTGGASGIGYALARAMSREGAAVVIADVEQPALDRAAAELGVVGILTDVSRAADVERLAGEVIGRHGRVDLVINNAGVARIAPFHELSEDDFAWVLDVNLWGVIHGMRTFVPLLESTSADGFLLNTASIAGLRNGPGLAAYTASKFAVVALTETLDQELRARDSSLGVGVLLPAMVRTGITDSERNRPGAEARAAASTNEMPDRPGLLSAEAVAEIALAGIARRDLYVITHPEALDSVKERHRRIEEAFGRS